MSNQKLNKKNKFLIPLFNLITITIIGISTTSYTTTANPQNEVVMSEITTNQTALSKKDVVNFFCANLTEYFNTYKYYKIFTEIYSDKERQNPHSTSRTTKQGNTYNIEYIGSAGKYIIAFSNRKLSGAEQIFTFGRQTILGNAIRKKIYDTYSAWLKRVEIALKSNYNSELYIDELNAAVEFENWYNNLNVN